MGNNNSNKFFNYNFFLRTVSAVLLAPVVLFIIYIGGFLFYMMVCIVAVLMAFEWNHMFNSSKI